MQPTTTPTPDEQLDAEALLESMLEDERQNEFKREELREKLGKVLIGRRDAAVKFRSASGIERQWSADQAYFEGEDDTPQSAYYKGLTTDSPLLSKPKNAFKSKIFLNITRPYCESASSKVIEVLSPVDDRAFSVDISPIPFGMMGGETLEGEAIPAELPGQPPQQQLLDQSGQPATAQQVQGEQAAKSVEARLRIAAKGAEKWIDDKLQQCGYNAQLRRLVDDAARIGTGIMRGPMPVMRTHRKVEAGEFISVSTIEPESRCISAWNLYPDPACGDDIHNGQFVIEHDELTEKQLRELQDDPSYLPGALEFVIEQGPQSNAASALAEAPHTSHDQSAKRFHVWYYHGFLSVDDVISMGCDCEDTGGGVAAVVTIINDTPVKAHLAPMSSGRFPYDLMCWQRVAGSPWGVGIARQIRSCQAILNATVRSMMENAGLSSGPQIILGRGSIIPADGKWEITPRKVWLLKPDADIPDVTKAFNAVQIPSIQAELLESVNFALKMAENVTGLPVLLQGQQGASGVPDTVGGMQILVANASSLLRRMARVFDDSITKPHVSAYYEWMMEFGEDASIKGDFCIVPRGSSALVIKDMRATFLMQSVPQMITNPSFGIDPARYFREVSKLNGLDAANIQFTEAELANLMQQPQPLDPRVEVANIRAQSETQIAESRRAVDQARISAMMDKDNAYVQAENERTQVAAAGKMAELQLRRELLIMELAHRDKLSIETIKAQLTMKGSDLDLRRELAQFGHISSQEQRTSDGEIAKQQSVVDGLVDSAAAKIEPAGRAPTGYSDSL